MSVYLAAMCIAEFVHGSLLVSHTISDDFLSPPMALQGFLQKRQSSGFITLFRDASLENFTFMVDPARKVMLLPVHLHEHFVEVRRLNGNRTFIIIAMRIISGAKLT